jgi:molybdopterin converting factor small subunit
MDITVHVRLGSTLKRYDRRDRSAGHTFEIVLPENSSLRDLILEIGIPLDKVGVAVVNLQRLEPEQALADGDEIVLLPPLVAGG